MVSGTSLLLPESSFSCFHRVNMIVRTQMQGFPLVGVRRETVTVKGLSQSGLIQCLNFSS